MDVIKTKLDVQSIHLAEAKIESFPDIINIILEYFIFFRWNYFKNRPRGNLLLVRSVLLVSMVFAIGYGILCQLEMPIFEGLLHPVLAFVLAVALMHWSMSRVFHEKSTFCANLYNDVIKAHGDNNSHKAELLEVTLSQHLIATDLWAHRTFAYIFSRTLQNAADHVFDSENKLEFFGNLTEGKLHVRDARRVLQAYLAHLMQDDSESAD